MDASVEAKTGRVRIMVGGNMEDFCEEADGVGFLFKVPLPGIR